MKYRVVVVHFPNCSKTSLKKNITPIWNKVSGFTFKLKNCLTFKCVASQSIRLCEPTEEEPSEIKESRETGSIAGKVYKAYFKAAGGWCTAIFVLVLFVLTQMASTSADYFIKFW